MRSINWLFAVFAPLLLLLAAGGCQGIPPAPKADWKQLLAQRIPEYGHRNWIVIADSAYPAQSRAGIETVVTDADQIDVLNEVLKQLAETRHVVPIVYTDAELRFVPEADAPGAEHYRQRLKDVLGDRPVQVIPHEQVIAKLDSAAQVFRVLVLKTKLTVPYTSVFLQLDCGYWGPAAEARLRDAMTR